MSIEAVIALIALVLYVTVEGEKILERFRELSGNNIITTAVMGMVAGLIVSGVSIAIFPSSTISSIISVLDGKVFGSTTYEIVAFISATIIIVIFRIYRENPALILTFSVALGLSSAITILTLRANENTVFNTIVFWLVGLAFVSLIMTSKLLNKIMEKIKAIRW